MTFKIYIELTKNLKLACISTYSLTQRCSPFYRPEGSLPGPWCWHHPQPGTHCQTSHSGKPAAKINLEIYQVCKTIYRFTKSLTGERVFLAWMNISPNL